MTRASQIGMSAERLSQLSFDTGNISTRRLLEKLPTGAYTCNAEGLLTYYNRKAAEYWGREPRLCDWRDRYCGSFRLYSADGAPLPREKSSMALALHNRRVYEGQELILERPDGSRLTMLAHATPVYDDAGTLTGAINVLVDISQRKRLEEFILRSNRELERRVTQQAAGMAAGEALLTHEVAERKRAEAIARRQATVASLLALANGKLQKQTRVQQASLRDLHRRIILAEEAERKQISNRLHESVGQMVTALLIELSLLQDSAVDVDHRLHQTIAVLNDLTVQIHDDVRHISHLLRPPAMDIIGLGAALYSLCEQVAEQTDKELLFQSAGVPRLSENRTIAFYRFVQEALDNAIQHSQASTICVTVLTEDDCFRITVEDDGEGFDASPFHDNVHVAQSGAGLVRARELLQVAGADLELTASPGKGTRLTASCLLTDH